MNKILFSLCLLFNLTVTSAQAVSQDQMQSWILEAVDEMPTKGGYVLTRVSPERLRDAFSWNLDQLVVDQYSAVPSYCTTATILVFYRALQKYWDYSRTAPSRQVLEAFKPKPEADGVRIWGRWNSNGPATAKLFTDTMMGENFDDISRARPGDFLKMFWNGQVGKNERGHSVVFLGREVVNGKPMIRFWSSNKDTDGYGTRLIPQSDAKLMLFSRLTRPENFSNILNIPETDAFLASMLSKVSNWSEVRKVSGF